MLLLNGKNKNYFQNVQLITLFYDLFSLETFINKDKPAPKSNRMEAEIKTGLYASICAFNIINSTAC